VLCYMGMFGQASDPLTGGNSEGIFAVCCTNNARMLGL